MTAKLKIKKGDRVIVTAGRDKGKTGEVLKIITKNNRVLVQGVNMVKRHQRPTQTAHKNCKQRRLNLLPRVEVRQFQLRSLPCSELMPQSLMTSLIKHRSTSGNRTVAEQFGFHTRLGAECNRISLVSFARGNTVTSLERLLQTS